MRRRHTVGGAVAGAVVAVLVAGSVAANDGYAGLGAGGLELQSSAAVAMRSEDLFLSPDEVRVEHVFVNQGPTDVEAVVAFPLPPLSPGAQEAPSATPPEIAGLRDLNYMGFTVTVDGRPVTYETDIRLLAPPPDQWAWGFDLLRHHGPDVTERLRALGVPMTFDIQTLRAWFERLPEAERSRLQADDLFVGYGEHEPPVPNWVVAVRYFWRQTFAAGQEVHVEHRYRPIKGGSVFYLGDDLVRDYCVDAPTARTLRGLEARMNASPPDEFGFPGDRVELSFLEYILTTATTWRGPIGRFRLTLDKGSPDTVVSLCLDGIRKVGPTTFRFEKRGFVPDRDLRILFASYRSR